jgi:CHU_C Type IX secretion signal domain
LLTRTQHIIVLLVMLTGFTRAVAQNAMPDTVCVGVSRIYQVNGASPLSTYTWTVEGVIQTSATNQLNASWNNTGVFLVTVQEHSPDGCDGDLRSGLVYVEPQAKANAGADMVVCFGSSVQLNGSGGTGYQWSPATGLSDEHVANPLADIPVAGEYNYVLTATNNNSCPAAASDTVVITVLPEAKVFAGNDTTTGPNQPVQLHASDVNHTGFTSYTWSPALGLNDWLQQNPVVTLDNDVTYTVTASEPHGCTASDVVTVRVSRLAEIYVPTAFAPNGVNSLLHAIPVGIREFRYFAIYNRYGQLVFKTANPAQGWDGTYKGIAQSSAGFVWMAEGVSYSGKVITKKGNVVLLR